MTEQNSGKEPMNKYQLKKVVSELEDIRGRNTELVSLYIPEGYDMSKISDFVTSEASEAENIKSKHTRKNVQAALDKIGRKVAEEHETPKNGVALFAGNVSETEGRPEIKVWEIIPPQPIASRRYRCDKEFIIEPLKKMIVDDRVYGLVAIDKNEAAIGYLQGSAIKTEYTMQSEVPGKTRAGGQCLDPETIVQMSNGELKPIDEVEVGDEVKAADWQSMELRDSVVTDRWEEQKKVYRIKTKAPSASIVASEDHEVFTADSGVQKKDLGSLEEGEKLLFPEKVESSSTEHIIPARRYYSSYRISEIGRKKLKQVRKKKEYSQKELGESIGRTQTAISKLELGERDVKRDFLKEICEVLELDFEEFIERYCRGKNFRLPTSIDRALAQILGYFAGDGSFDPERLNFHEADRDVADKYRELIEDRFECNTSIRFREEKNYYNLRAFGKPLVEYIKSEFPEIKKSGDSRIPKKILRENEDVIAAFLRGFYDAEGHCSETRGRIGISANNKIFMNQLQTSLLHLGIIGSLRSYDNRANPYSDKTRYTVDISGGKSILKFNEKVGFTAGRKERELEKIADQKKYRSHNRQIIKPGEDVRDLIEEHDKVMDDFKSANTFLQGRRNMSKKAFRKNLIEESEGGLRQELEKLAKQELLPAEIKEIEELDRRRTIDISVEAGNFVANGVIVHNSAQRFERIRKQMLKTFLNDAAENSKNAFLDKAREGDLLGILVGGPGWVKDQFVEDYLHQELKEHVVANKSLNYSGEEALEELVNKSEDAIQDAEAVKEKNLVQGFFDNLREENGKSEYGMEQVAKAMEMGAVETVLISEDFNHYRALYICSNGHEHEVFEKKPEIAENENCPECGEEAELEEMNDVVDVMAEKAEQMGSEVEIISSEHEEGQRLLNMGGVAAILRYRIR